MIFAALTANEGTQDAERNLAGFSSYLRELMLSGAVPRRGMLTFDQFVAAWKSGLAQRKFADFNNLLGGYERIVPALAKAKELGLQGDKLRRYIATTPGVGLPAGLGVTKFSFAMECWGENVACLDRWMFRALGADEKVGKSYFPSGMAKTWKGPRGSLDDINRKIAAHRKAGPKEERDWMLPVGPEPWPAFSDGAYVLSEYGGARFSKRRRAKKGEDRPEFLAKVGTTPESVVDEYEWWERKLQRTEYYRVALEEAKTDPRAALNPLARSQWTMWEDIMRRHPDQTIQLDKARHMPLWLAIHGRDEVIRRALIPYREHGEEVARKHLELQQRAVEGGDRRRRLEAEKELPGAAAEHAARMAELAEARGRVAVEGATKLSLLERRGNPKLMSVMREALAVKRGEVARASAEARRLAARYDEATLAEFARW
jgi:hypothetical protein